MSVNFQNPNIYAGQSPSKAQKMSFKGNNPSSKISAETAIDIVGWAALAGSGGISLSNYIRHKKDPEAKPQAKELKTILDITCIAAFCTSASIGIYKLIKRSGK